MKGCDMDRTEGRRRGKWKGTRTGTDRQRHRQTDRVIQIIDTDHQQNIEANSFKQLQQLRTTQSMTYLLSIRLRCVVEC